MLSVFLKKSLTLIVRVVVHLHFYRSFYFCLVDHHPNMNDVVTHSNKLVGGGSYHGSVIYVVMIR